MTELESNLAQRAKMMDLIGHPALLEHFVLRNGRAFSPVKRIGRKGVAKQCFSNATKFVMKNPGSLYVEGFTTTCGLPIHHAWVTLSGEDVMDPTLDANTHEYFGVVFPRQVLMRQLAVNGYYGLLDNGLCLNAELMFEIDPALRDIVTRVKS